VTSHFGEAHEGGFGVTGECSGEHIQKNEKKPGYLERGRSGRTEERGNSMERFDVWLSSVVMPRIL
jgi:hypothetical protein